MMMMMNIMTGIYYWPRPIYTPGYILARGDMNWPRP